MVGGREGFGVVTSSGAVAEAVSVVAEEGAALGDPEAGEGVKDFNFVGDGLALLEEMGFRLGDGVF